MPKVKILLSTYNGEKYLKEQLDSLLLQDYPNIKILVRDDGSVDSTLDILKDYQSRELLKYYKGENLGCGKSFWDLLQKSGDADFYAFCDQDDVWDKDKISRAVARLNKEDNNLPLLYCSNVRVVDSQLKLISKDIEREEYIDNFKSSLIKSLAPGCTFVFNRKSCEILRLYKSDFIDIHDWLSHKIIAAFGKVIKDGKSSMSYRQHGNNVIGAKNGISKFVSRIKKLISNKEHTRLEIAKEIYLNYKDQLSAENKEALKCMINYRNNKKEFYNLFKSSFSRTDLIMFKMMMIKEKI